MYHLLLLLLLPFLAQASVPADVKSGKYGNICEDRERKRAVEERETQLRQQTEEVPAASARTDTHTEREGEEVREVA